MHTTLACVSLLLSLWCRCFSSAPPSLPFKSQYFNLPGRISTNTSHPACPGMLNFTASLASDGAGSGTMKDGWVLMPQYARVQLSEDGSLATSIEWIADPDQQLPAWAAKLRLANFTEKVPLTTGNVLHPGSFDVVSAPGAGFTSPGPAGAAAAPLLCVKTSAGTFVGYRWYRFEDQPALQHLRLTKAQKSYLQRRVERLHDLLA